jgi:Putative Se/S carrier protein-like
VSAATQPTFIFDSTNAALWAEEVAKERSIPVDVVSAPAGSDARCDLALVTLAARVDDLERALRAAGVAFRRWAPKG